ncbi:uridine phosphorylase 1-like [Epargyreus clarus]|uniref:uridine phosphorylase 1-like n=1 Tax=Epargyreus clarus TaxID=520877 RepID=UPI003C2D2B2E
MCDCDYMFPSNDEWEKHYDNCKLVWEELYDRTCPRNNDGTLRLCNANLSKLETDFLYHLGFDTKTHNLPALFGDVKFVCMGGTKHRMRDFAKHIAKELKIKSDFANMTKQSHRYAMYKVGPVLSVSHGIGIPSMTILLQEVLKLLHYAKAKNPIFFRIGTSGGLKIPPGSVVISSWGMNGTLQKTYDIPILGKVRQIPSFFDKRLSQEVQSLASDVGFGTYIGGTMAADDFYRGQARLDGPICDHTEDEKLEFLNTLAELGVKNIEMEATAFAALTSEAGVRAADVCVTLLNRLEGDQVSISKATYAEYQVRPMLVVGRYITKYYVDKLKR